MLGEAEKAVRKVGGLLPADDGRRKRFGVGGGDEEQSCGSFRAFIECQGYLRTDRRVLELPAGSELRDARSGFEGAIGRPVRQTRILDEDGYELDPAAPVWRHSKACNISLALADQPVATQVSAAAGDGVLTLGRAWQSARAWVAAAKS